MNIQSGTAIFTIIAKNYLAHARVLMNSAAVHHPEWQRFVILADHVDGYFDPSAENFRVFFSSDLPIPHSRWFHFKYSVIELSTAVKPYAFEYFQAKGFDRVVYLDPDIRIYSPLKRIAEGLQTANIVLTPHLTRPLEDDRRPGEIDILRAGAYNLGFIGLATSHESSAFLAWWQQRLYDHCVVDLPRGLFVDQKWMDLVPGMFEGVDILRDPGYNVAYWNLSHRAVSLSQNGYEVAGSPLAFFHFSGYDAQQPDKLSRHQNRFQVENLPVATQRILHSYRQELLAARLAECRNWPYAFGSFNNGVPIPDIARPIHHEAPELVAAIDDPFSAKGFQAFVERWNSPVEEDGAHDGISRLAYRIYRTRSDLQSAMPDVFGGHYKRFLEWMLVSGRREHGLGDVFLTTIADAIATCKKHQEARAWPETPVPNEFTNEPAGQADTQARAQPRLRLTRLTAAIYASRPELQRYFPDPQGHDRARFLVWLLTYGRKEHCLSAAQIAPMKAQWRSIIGDLPLWPARVRYELIRLGMAASVHLRSSLVRLQVFRAMLSSSRTRLNAKPAADSSTISEPPTQEYGVNLVGYFHAETGIGQSARGARAALRAARISLSLRGVDDAGLSRQQDYSAGPMSSAFPYFANLFYVNADQAIVVRKSLGKQFYQHRYNIGYWVWELDEFPERWLGAFSPYHEIWTPSTFCRDAIQRKASIPVLCFPYAVAPVAPAGMDRQYFGLPSDRLIFLAAFDVLSVPERKNPLAAIRAFERAFGAHSRCQLVIKVNNAKAAPNYIEALRAASSNGTVRIFDSTLKREEMDALTNCVDCVVSLHRSEGFGLLIAEGMYFGKPVIVTNYSGNTDFTRPDNSMLVDFRLIPVGRGCAPYDPASLWADPDVEQAASHMKVIAGDPGLRQRIAGAGSEFVRAALSPAVVGTAMSRQLRSICEIYDPHKEEGHATVGLVASIRN